MLGGFMDEEKVIRLLEQHKSYAEVARILNCSRERIRQIARQRKLSLSPPQGYISVQQAAARLGYTVVGLRRAVRDGRIESVKVGSRYWVKEGARVEKYARTRHPERYREEQDAVRMQEAVRSVMAEYPALPFDNALAVKLTALALQHRKSPEEIFRLYSEALACIQRTKQKGVDQKSTGSPG